MNILVVVTSDCLISAFECEKYKIVQKWVSKNVQLGTLSISLTHTLSLSISYSISLSLSHTHTRSLTLSLSLSLHILGIAWSKANKTILTYADNTVQLWSFDTKTLTDRLIGHKDQVLCLYVLENYELVATGSMDCSIKLWDITGIICFCPIIFTQTLFLLVEIIIIIYYSYNTIINIITIIWVIIFG